MLHVEPHATTVSPQHAVRNPLKLCDYFAAQDVLGR